MWGKWAKILRHHNYRPDNPTTWNSENTSSIWQYAFWNMGQMGKWPWCCTTIGLDNSIKLETKKIRLRFQRHVLWSMGKPIWVKCPRRCATATLDNHWKFLELQRISVQQFQRFTFWPMRKPIGVEWATMRMPICVKWANSPISQRFFP